MDWDEAASYLKKNGWLATLPSHMQSAWLEGAQLITVKQGESLFHLGDAAPYMFGVARGVIGGYLSYNPDEALLLALYHPGIWAGDPTVMSNEARRGTAAARTDCTLLTVSKGHVELVAGAHPEIWRYLAKNVVFQFDSFMLLAAAALKRDPVTRLLMTLHRLHTFSYQQVTFEISVEELGHMTGLTRNTVTGALNKLQAREIVERSYRSITINDPIALIEALRGNIGPQQVRTR